MKYKYLWVSLLKQNAVNVVIFDFLKKNKLDLAILNEEKAVAIASAQNDKLLQTLRENL